MTPEHGGNPREPDEVAASTGPDRYPSLELLKTLGDDTRYAIYRELAESSAPLTTADLADRLGLHPNTIRPHLDRMRQVGVVAMATARAGVVGRPQYRYTLADDAPSFGLEPNAVSALARVAVDMAVRAGATSRDAHASGVAAGVDRAAACRGAAALGLDALVADLEAMGFQPHVERRDGSDRAVVTFGNCPFGDLAVQQPDIVCSLHHGLLDGFSSSSSDTTVVEFCPPAASTKCHALVDAGRQ